MVSPPHAHLCRQCAIVIMCEKFPRCLMPLAAKVVVVLDLKESFFRPSRTPPTTLLGGTDNAAKETIPNTVLSSDSAVPSSYTSSNLYADTKNFTVKANSVEDSHSHNQSTKCQFTPWTEWSNCPRTCKDGSFEVWSL